VTEPREPVELTCDDVRDLAAGFVLDALEPEEADAVRTHLATCDQPHPEIAELASALPALDASVPLVEPPAALKGRIMAAAATDLAAAAPVVPTAVEAPVGAVAATAPASAAAPVRASAADPSAPTPFPSATERAERTARRTSTTTWVVRIAAVLVIGALVGWNLLLRSQLDAAQQYQQDVAAVVDLASQAGSLTAVLRPDGGTGPAGIAAVGADGQLAMAMHDLPPTANRTVYEAWVVGPDGVPVALGSFTVGPTGTAYFQGTGVPADSGIVLGLTHEPGPGATTPTLPMVLSGTASATG
jgi:Anti-sigma-K factor rskA/Putative zinc-finger